MVSLVLFVHVVALFRMPLEYSLNIMTDSKMVSHSLELAMQQYEF